MKRNTSYSLLTLSVVGLAILGGVLMSFTPQMVKATMQYPSQVFNLRPWKLTLPVNTAHAGTPDEIKQPELATYSHDPFFKVVTNSQGIPGVQFRAYVNGATTSGSSYPRSELREMTADGVNKASWSTTSGTHTMLIQQAITKTPVVKPHVVAGQIHNAEDDVVMIRLEGKRLFIESNGDNVGDLDTNYTLGKVFTVQFQAKGGKIYVSYNGALKKTLSKSGSGMYFKAGAYTQSNLSKGDAATAYGEVVIYALRVYHN